jgi:hypothetical protein
VKLTGPTKGATFLVAGRSTGRLRWVAAGLEPRHLAVKPRWPPRGRLFTNMAQILLTPLTNEELASLGWISEGTPRVVIPAAHVENLLATGYVRESISGLALTDLGVWRLDRERAKKLT